METNKKHHGSQLGTIYSKVITEMKCKMAFMYDSRERQTIRCKTSCANNSVVLLHSFRSKFLNFKKKIFVVVSVKDLRMWQLRAALGNPELELLKCQP